MIAYIACSSARSKKKITAFVKQKGFEIIDISPEEFVAKGNGDFCSLLVDLKYKYPIGYVSGWTSPDEKLKALLGLDRSG